MSAAADEPVDLTVEEVRAEERPGRFGRFGGRYVPEALVPALEQLDEARQKAAVDPEFQDELARLFGCADVGSNTNAAPTACRSMSMHQLFGQAPVDGNTVSVGTVPSAPIVVVAARRFVANVVTIVAAVSDVDPISTCRPE